MITSTGWSADICVPSREAEGFSEPTNQGPNSSEDIRDCRTGPGTASKWWNNVETEQLILGSDEDLPTGGMLIPSVLSQQAHMVPCCRRLQQECLFSRRCLQITYTVLYTCWMTMLHRKTQTLSEQSRLQFWSRCCHAVDFFQSQWHRWCMIAIKAFKNLRSEWFPFSHPSGSKKFPLNHSASFT